MYPTMSCVINLAFRFQVPCFYDQLRRCRQDFGKISSTCQLRNDLSIVRAGYRLVRELTAASKHGILQLATDAPLANAFSCDTCGLSFPTQKALRVHEFDKHGRIVQTTAIFRKEVHAKGDMPICSGCDKVFTRWAGLERHINNNRCEQPVNAEMPNEPGPVGSVQLQLEQPLHTQSSMLLNKTPAEMLNVPGLAKRLTQNCAFCKQWVASTYMVKNHYRNSHAKMVEDFHDKAVSLSKQQLVGVPCQFCASTGKARHSERCTVLYQWHMLQLYWQGQKNESGGAGRSIRNAGTSSASANPPPRKPPPSQGHATLSKRQRTQSLPGIGRKSTSQRTRSLDGDRGQNTSETRREHQRDPPEHRLHAMVHDPKGPALDPASVAEGLGRLETIPRQRYRLSSKQNLAQGCADAVPRESSPGSAMQRRPTKACTRSKLANSQSRVDVVKAKMLKVDGTRSPTPHNEMLTKLQTLMQTVTAPEVVHRFRSTRPLRENMEGNVLPFLLDLGLTSPPAMDAQKTLRELTESSVFQVIGVQIRKQTLQRSQLATMLHQYLQGC